VKYIKWTPKALRQIRKIRDKDTRIMIYSAVDNLKDFPKCKNVKKFKDLDKYRLRVGLWRVIFKTARHDLLIKEIKKRDEHTY
jgi:mRNA-degrading endonuclease RelE of RelBE toxin-antitoxin system